MNRQMHHAEGVARNAGSPTYDVSRVRLDFPALHQQIRGKPLVYLDNAATTQKPQSVIDAEVNYYKFDNSNVHRGIHTLSMRATDAYEGARRKIASFLNAADPAEVIFVRGTTEGINLVAWSYAKQNVGPGDEILISAMEHHSNIVPWQILCGEKRASLRVSPMNERGELLLDEYERLLTPRTRLVSVVYASNSLGTVNPVGEMIRLAHERNIPVLLDGAQAPAHLRVDVQALDCDFFVCSGHKMYGPMGIGVVYGKRARLEKMPPYQGGGDMILTVSFEGSTYNNLPYKFEAGTPNITGVVGLGAAVDYLEGIDFAAVAQHEHALLEYATQRLLDDIPGARVIGTAAQKASVLSFVIDGIHPHDLGTIVDREGVAIRTGHHCAMPIMERFGVPATARASFAFYNDHADVDRLIAGLTRAVEIFRG
jgi:cysteine desulfurase/selenocysteine lyase